MWLMLYLCKVFGFTHLTIDDNFKVACDNYDTVHQNILLFLDDQPSVYEKFGFKLDYKDEQQKNDIISKYQSQDLDVFDKIIDTDGLDANQVLQIAKDTVKSLL